MKPDKSTTILLYGAGEIGAGCAQKLIDNGYQVTGFIDRKKSGVEPVSRIPIYQFGIDRIDVVKSDCIVIICLADGLQHKDVALGLLEKGYRYILCLPMNLPIPPEKKTQSCVRYNLALDGLLQELGEIDDFGTYLTCKLECEEAILMQLGEMYITWVREECLFTEWERLWRGDKSKTHGTEDGQNINIAAYTEFQQLFWYLDGESSTCEEYWKCYKLDRTPEEKEEMVKSREKLMRSYEREYAFGMDFFIASAASAVWNDKGYWNLHGGHHRTCYLHQRGHVLFPVRVHKDEFELWCNREKLDAVKRYLSKHHISKTAVPVPHPAFVNFEAERELRGDTILGAVLRFLRGKIHPATSVLDCSFMEGYFARNLARISEGEIVYSGKKNIELVQMLNELLSVSNITCVREDEDDALTQAFDIVFWINRCDRDIGNKMFQARMDESVNRYLFIEAEAEKLQETDIIRNTSFRYYQKLHCEVWLGKMRETGVFIK